METKEASPAPGTAAGAASEKMGIQRLNRQNSQESLQDEDVEPIISWRIWLVVLSSALAYSSMIITVTASGFHVGAISAEIGGTNLQLWLSQALQLVSAVLGPPLSRIGDYYGRKWIVVVCLLFGAAGNFIIASANSMEVAIAGSAIHGVLYAAQGNTFAIASEVVPRRWRGVAQVINNYGGNSGVLLGAIAGTGLVQHNPGGYSGWRAIFWMAGAFAAVVAILIFFVYHPPPAPYSKVYDPTPVLQKVLSFDIVGSILLGCGLVPLLMGLIWGGETYPWNSARIISLVVVGFVMLGVFAVHQIWFEKHGMCDHRLFQSRNFTIALVGIFVEGMIYITYNQYYGKQTALLYEQRAVLRALRFCTFILGTTIGGLINSYTSYKFRVLKPQIITGFFLFLVATIGLATAKTGSGKVVIFYCFLAGLGFSAPIVLLVAVIQLAVPAELIGLSSALMLSFRAVGGAIGVAIAAAVYESKDNSAIPRYLTKAATDGGLPEASIPAFVTAMTTSNVAAALSITGVTQALVTAARAALKEAHVYSLKYIWITLCPFIVVATISAIMLTSSKSTMNAIIDRPVEPIHHNVHVEHTAPSNAKLESDHAEDVMPAR